MRNGTDFQQPHFPILVKWIFKKERHFGPQNANCTFNYMAAVDKVPYFGLLGTVTGKYRGKFDEPEAS